MSGYGRSLTSSTQCTEEEESSTEGCLAHFEKSPVFRSFIMTIIILNTVELALEADYPNDTHWDIFDDAFLYIYCGELLLRLAVHKMAFFYKGDWRWNWFDFLIVLTGLLHQWVIHSQTGSRSLGKLVIAMRVMRLLRILRAVKIFNMAPELQRLMVALFNSMASVAWIAFFFFVLVLVFSIFVTIVVGNNLDDFDDPEDRETVKDAFGTIFASMITLSVWLTLDDWSDAARTVNKVYPLMEFVWIIYIVIGAFMILSLLTGLMADKMSAAREELEDNDTSQDIEELEKRLQNFKERFDDTGWQDCDEFKEMFVDADMREVLDRCGVKVTTESGIEWLFRSIDRDADGRVTWEEFHEAFTNIGRHNDKAAALKELLWIEGKVQKVDKLLEAQEDCSLHGQLDDAGLWDRQLDDVHARSSLLRRRLVTLESDLQEFFRAMRQE